MDPFKKFIAAGKSSASLVSENIEQVNAVFEKLNQALSEETEHQVSLQCFREQSESAIGGHPLPESGPVRSPDGGMVNIIHCHTGHLSIARWHQHPDGYPFTVEFLGERTDCWDSDALIDALASIISSGQFWLKVKELEDRQQSDTEKLN